ncbi:MAG: hypothetical protein Q8R11_02025 [bacterium]|nr:hypothetical protein [bacterium]
MFFVFKALIVVACLIVILGVVRTWQMERAANQKLFVGGEAPTPAPDGLYNGNVPGRKVSWLGKKFNAATQTGINVFDDGNGVRGERYPFKTEEKKGVHDGVTVLAIDYNIPENPFWLRPILDEIVQVAPDKYLGKLHVRIIPGFPFTLAYFELSK